MRFLPVLAFATALGCVYSPPGPPPRPEGVPPAAVWAGGVDGGDWLLCSPDEGGSRGEFACQVFSDQTGDITARGRYVFAECSSAGECAPQADVPPRLAFRSFDGIWFHLEGGLALVPDGEIDHPFGDGHGKRVVYSLGREVGPEVQY